VHLGRVDQQLPCYTSQQAAQDPLNACAPETANGISFTTTVPTHPTTLTGS